MNVLIYAKLSEKKLKEKITPLIHSDKIDKIILVRKNKFLNGNVKTYYTPKIFSFSVLSEFYRFFISFYVFLKFRIDIICGIHLTYHGYFAYIFSKIFKKPFIYFLINDERRIMKSRFSFLHKIIIKSADIIITRGRKVSDNLVFIDDKSKFKVIPNHFLFKERSNTETKKKIDLLYIGNFHDAKRVDILLAAIKQVNQVRCLNVNLTIVGYDSRINLFSDKAKRLNINDKVNFVGWQDDVDSYFRNSKIFIMTSQNEGLPQAMIEALAHGIPCIMPKVSNIPEVAIHDYNSLLVEPLDVDGFADAIHRIMTDEELYNKLQKGAENFRAEHEYEYSMENISHIWDNVLTEIEKINYKN